jgi:hypothetical protein
VLQRRANSALARLDWWDRHRLPSSHQRPQTYEMLLSMAAADMPALANDRAYLAARNAASAWSAASDLYK